MRRMITSVVVLATIGSVSFAQYVVPTITSLTPANARAGQSLSIGGSGYSFTLSEHKVFIGGMRASVTGASEGGLTVSVPYGATYGPVQASTIVGKTTFSHLPFTPTFAGGDFNSSSFGTPQTITHETTVRALNVGDFDGDGKPDLVVGNYEAVGSPTSSWYLSVYPNTSSGSTISFGSLVHIPSLAGVSAIYTADMNGDGKLDIVTVNGLEASNGISVFYNTSSGTGNFAFASRTDFASIFTVNSVTFQPRQIAIGDLDKDGYLDMGVIYNSQYLRIILNNESGTWSTPYQESDIGEPRGIGFVDLNSDGKLDIAIPNALSDTSYRMYINNSTAGSISFGKSTDFPSGSVLGRTTLGDIDGDYRMDLLTADASVQIHRKSSTAFVFDAPVTLTTGEADYIALGDVDGDTKVDLVVSAPTNHLRVYRNTSTSGSVSFATGIDFAAGGGIKKPIVADLNADGKPEIIYNHVTSDDYTISILKNLLPSYSLSQTLIQVSDDTVQAGSSVTVSMILRDNTGQATGAGGPSVVFSVSGGGTSTGTLGTVGHDGYGTYTATLTGVTAGSARTITATIGEESITSTPPSIIVIPGPPSLAQSQLTIGSSIIVEDQTTPVTLRVRDSVGNDVAGGGLTVAFSLMGNGTSGGSFNSVADSGNGRYGAMFTGTAIGTANSIVATIGGDTITSSLPGVTVQSKVASAAQSLISVSPTTFQSGTTSTVTVQARNSSGTNLIEGGDAVALFLSVSGQSSGTFTSVVDHGDGTYTAILTGVAAGTARAIGGTINGDTISTTLPTFTVTPGPFSLTGSTLSVSPNPVPSGSSSAIAFQARDAAGNAITQGGLSFTLSLRAAPIGGGGTSTGEIGSVAYQGGGLYTAPLLGLVAGSASTLDVTVSGVSGGGNKTNALPLVTVIPGAVSLAQSVVTVDLSAIPSGLSTTVRLQAKDSVGNDHTSGGLGVVFSLTGAGSSDGTFGSVTDNGDGTYASLFTGTTVGTSRSVAASIGGDPVTSSLPTVTVTVGPPTISSFTPTSDSAGTSIVVTGTNFSETLSQNAVFFGTIPASVTAASSTSLTTTVPVGAGSGPLTVVNLSSGLSVVSEAAFQKRFRAGGYIDQTSLASRLDIAASAPIAAVAVGDLDGDGLADVVGTLPSASAAAVYLNTGSPGSVSFASPSYLWSGGQSQSVGLADIDGDGRLDIVTQNPNNAFSLAVLRNTSTVGSISFAAAVAFNTASGTTVSASALALADFNSDGKIDVASVYEDASVGGTDHKAIVVQNTSVPGTLAFASPVHLPLSAAPRGAGAGDLDGDGRSELVVTESNASTLVIFRNTTVAGVLGFAVAQEFATAAGPYGVAVADVNDDGKKDVLIANRLGSGSLSVFKNTSTLGSVALDTRVDVTTQDGSSTVVVGDLDGDAMPDLSLANENAMSLSLLKNATSGGVVSLAASMNVDAGAISGSVAIGDLDGDGKPDAAIAASSQNRFSVFRNAIGAYSPQQSLVTLSDDSVQSGSTVQATLTLKDLAGNTLALTGQTVTFSLTGGGTSTGAFGPVTDNGDGTYTSTFTGGIGGTPRPVGASINSTPLTSVLPTITVRAGSYSIVHSTLSAAVNPPSINVMSAGDTLIIMLTARDSSNNAHTIGGLDVQPFRAGAGTSNGSFVSTADNGNGTYTIRFAGTVSGTTDSLGVTINGDTLLTPKIRYAVQPGAVSLSQSVISVVTDTVSAGVSGAGEFRLTLRDAYGNLVTATTGTDQVQFSLLGGGTSSGLINHPDGGWAAAAGPGIYYATFTGTTAGSPTPVAAVINGSAITSASPTITVIPGQVSLSNSYVTIGSSALGTGSTMNVTLHAYDTQNNPMLGDVLVQFTITTGGGTYGSVTYSGNGDYTASFTGGELGTKYISAQIYKNGIWQGITSYETVQILAALDTPSPSASGGGSALEMSGAGYVSIPDAPSLRLTNNFTLEAWIYPTGSTNLTIVDKGSYNYLFSFRPNATTGLGFYTSQTGWIYSGGSVPQNQWSHVAMAYSEGSNGIRFYLNGSLLGTATSPATIASNTGPVNIGRQAPGNCDCNLWQGKIDEVRIWNVARSTEEIAEDLLRSLGSVSGLLASYNMNIGSGTTLTDASGNGNNGTLVDAISWTASGASIQTVQATEPTLSWSSVVDASTYRVQLSSDAGFATILVDTSVSSTSVTVTGLSLSTTYHWRVKAQSGYNSSPFSSGVSFVTTSTPPGPPSATTTASTGMTMSTAQLNGVIASNGAATSVRFAYGTSSGVTIDTVTANQSPLDAFDSSAVSVTISGLTHSQTYYVRVIASNGYGSSQGNEVSFSTTPPPVLSSVAGSALVLDGSNDYVSTPLTDLSGSEITIEYWFKGSAATSAVRQQVGGDYVVAPWSDPPTHILSNDGGSAAGISAGSTIHDGQWHHVAMTWKQDTENGFKSYLDGVLVAQRNSSNTPIPNMATTVYLGSYVGSSEFTNGMMDEVRIWRKARSAMQIRQYMHRPVAADDSGLVAYWQVNEASGTTIADSVGSNHGTLVNGAARTTSTIPFGGTSTNVASGFTSGPLTLGSLSMTVTNPSATPVDLVATDVPNAPNTTQGILGIQTSDRYWILEAYDTPGTFSADVTFDLSPGVTLDAADLAAPANLRLYRRSSNANGTWTEIASATSATSSTVTFSGVSTFGQYLIGRSTAPALPAGSGTVGDPYQIASLGNLLWISADASRWNKHYLQTADIDASETSLWNGGAGWSPIGTSATRFTGTYDGQHHTIDGLYISRNSTNDIGLFGRCNGSTITNVELSNVSVSGSFSVGALVGNSDGSCTVSNSSSSGNVSGVQYVGGLVGFNYGGSSISASHSSANVSGSYHMGGLVGGNYGTSSIINCHASGSVSASDYAGGLLSYNYNNSTVTNSFSTGSVTSGGTAGGLVAWNSFAAVDSSFWDTQTSGQSGSDGGTGRTTAEMKTPSLFTDAGWDLLIVWEMNSYVNGGYPNFRWQTTPAAPTATTNAVADIGPVSAHLSGSVNAHNDSTVVRFLYGTASGVYTDSIAADQSPLVSTFGTIAVSTNHSSFSADQTYYVRVSASNAYGYARGDEVSFTTPPIPSISTVPGTALSFDGTNDYVTVSASPDFEVATGTIELWMRPNWSAGSMGMNPGIVANRSGSDTRYSLHIHDNLNAVQWWNGGSLGSINYSFTQGQWYHLAWVTSGGTSTLYVNGQSVGTTGLGFGSATSLPLTIGGTLSGEYFKGDLDEVRIWNVARTEGQIREHLHKALTGTESGLVSYWQFNEGTGTAASDPVGEHPGTLLNSVGWTASTVPFGAGTSISVAGFTTGTTSAGTAAITTTDPFDGPVDLTVTEVGGAPNTTSGTSGNLALNRYWIIELYGTPGTFSVDLTLRLEPGAISIADIASPSNLKLYRRHSTSDGAWTEIASGSSATDSTVTFAGITSFSQFTVGSTSSPLPVQMVGMRAEIISGSSAPRQSSGQEVRLSWTTASEVDNAGWEVERRVVSRQYGVGSKEKEGWVKIGFVEGAGTSTSAREYSFTDRSIFGNRQSSIDTRQSTIVNSTRFVYRLKQLDRSGAFSYSHEVEVEIGTAPREFTLGQNYPNPFNPATSIEFTVPADGRAVLKVFDMLGREVATLFEGVAAAGRFNRISFDASHLPSGLYFYRLESETLSAVRTMVILK